MIKAGIVGGTGYVAGELVRLLVHHPEVDLDFVYSHSQPGIPLEEVHQDLFWQSDLQFSEQVNPEVEVVFLAMGHGHSRKFLVEHPFSAGTKVIDLSNEFRLAPQAQWEKGSFVYGLPELHQEEIADADYIANPGCFATAIQLALLPLAEQGALKADVHIHAITGSTGAGQSLKATSHFSYRNNNLSVYKPFNHQHLGEIAQSLGSFHGELDHELHFLPLRGDFTRGIFASLYTETEHSEEELKSLYQEYYQDSPFTHLTEGDLHLKQVVNTNHCALQVSKHGNKALILSAIDNLLKGAAGQAVHNMNLQFGFPETTGLHLKASFF